MFLYFVMISYSFNDYYYVAQKVYGSAIFWLFGFFFMPIAAIYIDWLGYYGKLLVLPTQEMLFREFEHNDEFNNLHMMTCLSRGGADRPLSSERISEEICIDNVYPDSLYDMTKPSSSSRTSTSKKKRTLSIVDL